LSLHLPEPCSTSAQPSPAAVSGRTLGGLPDRARSVLSFSRWTIAAHVTAIVLTSAVPLNLMVFAVVRHLSLTANETQQTGLLYTARSVAAAVDAKLGEYMALAHALARSPALFEDNLEVFEAEARRAFATADAWILVGEPTGQQLFNMARPPGRSLPVRDPSTRAVQERAFETRSTIIADVRIGKVSQEWIVNIEVPVFKNGQPFRVLAVAVKARLFFRLLNEQQIPKDWLACIIDNSGHFVARVPGYERTVGQLAAEGFRQVKDQDGIFEFLSVDGDRIVTANAHSAASGWAVAIAVKKAEMQTAAWSTIRWAAILGGSLSLLSLLFAGAISRRITGPIAALRQKAGDLLTDPASVVPPKGPLEVSDLWEALKQSATSRIRAQETVRESEERFRGIFEHAGTGIAIKDLEGRFQSCNPAYSAMLDYSGDELRGLSCRDLMHPDDYALNTLQQERLLAGGIISFESMTRYFGKQGKELWGHRRVSLLRDESGQSVNLVVLLTDMTSHKRHEEEINLLMREVNHRSKNMLAVVQAIARQTAAVEPKDFIVRFGERIQALATSQDLLVKNEWRGVALDELVRSQLAHFSDLIGTRITVRGPSLVISAPAAQALGMALHELATNAGKYGALSNGAGRVEIWWNLSTGGGGQETFMMNWRENGGPPVAPPAKRGFGSIVISKLAKESLRAEIELDFAVEGLSWTLQCPAYEVLSGTGQGQLHEPINTRTFQ
jgi:PAS domain S-box-containing protein